jgi:hypothetical protein
MLPNHPSDGASSLPELTRGAVFAESIGRAHQFANNETGFEHCVHRLAHFSGNAPHSSRRLLRPFGAPVGGS